MKKTESHYKSSPILSRREYPMPRRAYFRRLRCPQSPSDPPFPCARHPFPRFICAARASSREPKSFWRRRHSRLQQRWRREKPSDAGDVNGGPLLPVGGGKLGSAARGCGRSYPPAATSPNCMERLLRFITNPFYLSPIGLWSWRS